MFASRINYQVPRYVAWHPDPGAHAIDAFSLNWGTEQFYAFPPFSLLGKVIQKIHNDKAHGILIVQHWTTQPWYPQMMKLLVAEPLQLPKRKDMLDPAIRQEQDSPSKSKTTASGMSLVRTSLKRTGISEEALNIIMASWRPSTHKQYSTYIKKWQTFCEGNDVDIFSPAVEEVLQFLTKLYQANCGYSSLNTARSALATVVILPGNIRIGDHPLISRFLKGVFQMRPALPRYTEIWDIDIVLNYLRTISPANKLNLKLLTYKVTMLLTLLTGQRIQTIQLLNIDFMKITSSCVRFKVHDKVKQTRPGSHLKDLSFKAYAPDRRLCILTYLTQYLVETEPLRTNGKQLLISFAKPHTPVSRDTIILLL